MALSRSPGRQKASAPAAPPAPVEAPPAAPIEVVDHTTPELPSAPPQAPPKFTQSKTLQEMIDDALKARAVRKMPSQEDNPKVGQRAVIETVHPYPMTIPTLPRALQPGIRQEVELTPWILRQILYGTLKEV